PPISSFIAAVIAFLAASLLRWHERNARLTADLRVETDELRTQATWLEQRTALARELHDVVGHHVTAMVVQAEAGQVSDPEPALRRIAETGRAALRELDALVVHLRDPDAAIAMTAPPRLGDIDELLAEPLRQHGVMVSVDIDADHGLDEVGSLAVYRVAQEALTNITRHAKATSAWVEVRRLAAHVRLRVSDDGIGPPAYVERGAGLVGITERVAALQGTFEMSTRPGGGTMVDVVLPVSEA
ncbi:sensor histidine kinase, partial [Nocardioides sp.]|uniref:sensor histidine kinase n=1 Tax=Nocardioides sp. TaxID=35761 RepID=UPI002D05E001